MRLLRRAGVPVGPADALLGARALLAVGVGDRAVVRAALRCSLLHRRDDFEVFEQAFALWWRPPDRVPPAPDAEAARPSPAARRVAEALAALRPPPAGPEQEAPPRPENARRVSERERLSRLDFEAMGGDDLAAARREMRRLALPLAPRPTRRVRPDPAGPRTDLRATVREALRRGGEVATIRRARRAVRPPPLVVLCDISGSMAVYARVLLFFLHALSTGRARAGGRTHAFLFGTRLSDVSRALRTPDPDAAMAAVARIVPDWSGGTRIGEAIALFNRRWSRRVLGGGATVLLITDGLDREGAAGLAEAASRLRRSARRLVWLNPLLRWDGFRPRSQGARALLPQVHEHRPVHDLRSLRDLVRALSVPAAPAPRPPAGRPPAEPPPTRPRSAQPP